MKFVDFEFDNHLLSDYGCVPCHIESTTAGLQVVDIGSKLSFSTIHFPHYNKFKISSAKYTSAYSTVIEICKTVCSNQSDMYFSDEEISEIMRWLNRKEYKKFKTISQNGEKSNVYFMCSFNIKPIVIAENVVGFELTMITDSPIGYLDSITVSLDLSTVGSQKTLHNISEEEGIIYPNIKVTCLSDGALILTNSADTRKLIVDNCKSGEVITIHGETKEIESNVNHINLNNDYKYSFPRIVSKIIEGNDVNDNIFSSNIPCIVEITYTPRCKLGVI